MDKKQAQEFQTALDQLHFSPEAKARLTQRLTQAVPPRRLRPIVAVPLAAAVCALLLAAAVAPKIWTAIQDKQGAFTPYAQTVEGAVAEDQGIEFQVLSALADDVQGQLYFSVQDRTGDRLDPYLELYGTLSLAEEVRQDEDAGVSFFHKDTDLRAAQLLSYDPASKTALYHLQTWFGNEVQPVTEAKLRATWVTTQNGSFDQDTKVSCAALRDKTLKSLPAGADSLVSAADPSAPPQHFQLGDPIYVPHYRKELLPRNPVVLAPEQNPQAVEGTEDFTVSSLGFASDGCLHLRLKFAPGVDLVQDHDWDGFDPRGRFDTLSAQLVPKQPQSGSQDYWTCLTRRVEDGLDFVFPLVHPHEAGKIDSITFFGTYARPGTALEGNWSIDFPLEHYPSTVLPWTGTIGALEIETVTVSPLTVTIESSGAQGFGNTPLYALRKDGSIASTTVSTGTGRSADGGTQWKNFNTWSFNEPVDVADLAELVTVSGRIPVELPD